MIKEQIIIIGAGPCGLAAGLALKEKGYNPLIIEKENVANSIYRYPAHQTFFSSSEKLGIGGYPFPSIERKPKRHEALVYYRTVAERSKLRIQSFEKVLQVTPEDASFTIETETKSQERKIYDAKYVIVATGYYDHPNMMGVEGENLSHVFHYFKEAHPYYNQRVTIIGGKNSAVDAALALEQAGAFVTVIYRGDYFSKAVKPWILPDFHSLVRREIIDMHFNSEVEKITKTHVIFKKEGKKHEVPTDFVFAMTGYHPDHTFLKKMGVEMDKKTGRPTYNEETMESNVKGLFIAGVIAAGNDANEIFIENGRFHGGKIVQAIHNREGGEVL